MRPTLLGEVFTPVSMLFAAAGLLTGALTFRRVEKAISTRNLVIASIVCIFWVYLSIHSFALDARRPENIVKALVSIPFLVFVFGFLLSKQELNRVFFRAMVWLFVLFTISYFITLALLLFFPLDSLFIYRTDSFYGEKWGGIYFPFTTAYGVFTFYGVKFFRSLGPFREAGIFQAFLVWAFIVLPYIDMNRRWIKVVLVAGIFSTLSTAGIAIFFATLALKTIFVSNGAQSLKRILVSSVFTLITFGIGSLAFLYLPVLGLLEKMEKAQASIDDRVGNTVLGLYGFFDNPFGIGMYNASIENMGINLLSALYMIGLPGLLLVIFIAVVSVITINNRFERTVFLVSMLPFAITGILSQPFLESPLVFIMLFQVLAIRTVHDRKVIEGAPMHNHLKAIEENS